MRARLKDVAEKAGVAVNTASMILNHRANSWASKDTTERVFRIARELNYRPSRTAVALRLGKFNTVGLIIPDLQNPFYTGLAAAVETGLRAHGYDLLIENSRSEIAREGQCLEGVLDRQVDGLICALMDGETHRKLLQELFDEGKPVVALAESPALDLPVDCVTADFAAGMSESIQHLTQLGHRRIAFLTSAAHGQAEGSRPAVFRALMQRSGVAAENVEFARCDHTLGGACAAVRELIEKGNGNGPTALIAHNDLSALGAMRAAAQLGLAVPRDFSIVGVDNTPLGEFLPVSLTTVDANIESLVGAAVDLLLKRLPDPKYAPPQRREVGTRLIVRESTGVARA